MGFSTLVENPFARYYLILIRVIMKTIKYILSVAFLNIVFCISGIIAEENEMSTNTNFTSIIFNFNEETDANQWMAVNDNVMGGVSKGNMLIDENNNLLFFGSLSFENNGGFSSIRTLPKDFEIQGYTGIKIRVKGDGRIYQFRISNDRTFDGVAFKQDFKTINNVWMEIDLPFASFLPTFRGRILTNVKPVSAAEIRQMGFLIADKKEGNFNLLVSNIWAYK